MLLRLKSVAGRRDAEAELRRGVPVTWSGGMQVLPSDAFDPAEAESRRAVQAGQEAERAMWEGMQGSFKVLINSFYGYLGYSGGLFNDYDAAERVTIAGQRIVKQVVANLQQHGATPIEVDTDGVYFVPPSDVDAPAFEQAFIDEVAANLPAGIRLSHDGRYAGMLSLRLKTYALLSYDGTMTLKGSALRSRRMEPFLRRFLVDAARRGVVIW